MRIYVTSISCFGDLGDFYVSRHVRSSYSLAKVVNREKKVQKLKGQSIIRVGAELIMVMAAGGSDFYVKLNGLSHGRR